MKNKLGLVMVSAALAASMMSGVAFAKDDRVRLRCDSEGAGDISMDARYKQRRNRVKFDGSFEAAPGGNYIDGDMLTVSVGGEEVGQLMLTTRLNGDLEGDIEFDTRVDENDPFPENFPEVFEGTSVTIGTLGCDLD